MDLPYTVCEHYDIGESEFVAAFAVLEDALEYVAYRLEKGEASYCSVGENAGSTGVFGVDWYCEVLSVEDLPKIYAYLDSIDG